MSETWVELADSDVMAANSQERVSVAAVKGRDDLQEICGQVVELVRQAYLFSNRDLGAEGTIPSGLKERAAAIALWRFVSEGVAKNEGIQTKQRESAATEARAYLDRIASAEIGKVSAPSVRERRRRFSHREEDGI
jgi:hypothetical protein